MTDALNIVLFGGERSSSARLILPHPRLRERLFVLGPLAELAPDLALPPDGVRADEASRLLSGGPRVRRISSRRIVRAGLPNPGS